MECLQKEQGNIKDGIKQQPSHNNIFNFYLGIIASCLIDMLIHGSLVIEGTSATTCVTH